MKNCIFCKHCELHTGTPDYSECTPGEDMSMECKKKYWELKPYEDSLKSYRNKILMAETCKDYVHYKVFN